MKVDQRGLDAIEVKIRRAKDHLGILHREMTTWDERSRTGNGTWGLMPEVHDEGRKHFFRLRFTEPFPVDWAVVLGEALHDLRSALDQCVYWLTVDWSGHDPGGTAFPVCKSKAHFYERHSKGPHKGEWTRTSGIFKVRGIGPEPLAFIERLQPYPQRRHFSCWEIRTLNDLWNQDKHRLVHLWGLRFDYGELRLLKEVAADSYIGVDRRVLHDGAIPVKVLCGTPHQQVKVKGAIGANISFLAGKSVGGPSRNFWDLAVTIEDVIRKLLKSVGNQTTPINASVWSVRPAAAGRLEA